MAGLAPGERVDGTPYRIVRRLGAGGMGEVYEAEHEHLKARRALKVLSTKHEGRRDLVARLTIEARALARVSHPGVVQVHDLGFAADGRAFVAMELLAGETLRDVLSREGALPPRRAVGIAVSVLEALGAAHHEGIVHRDIKPENLFLTGADVVKLLDFGIAKAVAGDVDVTTLTAEGAALGTPRYMSPEQAQGLAVDARSDLFSVAVVLWEMLQGEPPHRELEAVAAAVATITRGIPRLDDTSLPAALVDVVEKGLSVAAVDRYPTAEAFRRALASAVQECPTDPDAMALSMDERFGDTEVDERPRGAHTRGIAPPRPRDAHELTTRTRAPRAAPAEAAKRTVVPWVIAGLAVAVAAAGTFWVMRPRTPTVPAPTTASTTLPSASSAPPAPPSAPVAPPPSSARPTTTATPGGKPTGAAPTAAPGKDWLPPSGL